MILDPSDFDDRPYRIPNQQESKDFPEFVEAAEEEILVQLLGYEFYKELSDALNTSNPDQIYIDFRDGAEYESGGKTYKYSGLVDLLKPAVFSLWTDQNAYKFTNIGHIVNSPPQQATVIDNEPFAVGSWNAYVKLAGGYCGYSRSTWNRKDNLYGFYLANKSDYPTIVWKSPELRNRLGF